MSLNTEDAVSDEPILGLVPTSVEVGRQFKRLRTSATLNGITVTRGEVTDAVVGNRFATATKMVIQMAVNNPNNPGGEPPRNGDLIDVLGYAIRLACGPGGPISEAIRTACGPGGPIRQAIHEACDPGGPIRQAIHEACDPGGPIRQAIHEEVLTVDERTRARLHNGNVHNAEFPNTSEEFAGLTVLSANALLRAYGLPVRGTRLQKIQKLSAFCNVNLPKGW